MPRAKKEAGEATAVKYTGPKQWPVEQVMRTRINMAPYNPRYIHASNRSKLKKSLERFGLVESLVWNKQTGHLIGGHQRLSIMDEENNYPAKDYAVQVSVVNLDPDKEKELNIALNSPSLQGDWDVPKMADLLEQSKGIKLEFTGIDPLELQDFEQYPEFEGRDFSHLIGQVEARQKPADEETLRKMKQAKKGYVDQAKLNDDAGNRFVVVFPNRKEKETFLANLNIEPEAEFVDGRRMALSAEIDCGYQPEPDPK